MPSQTLVPGEFRRQYPTLIPFPPILFSAMYWAVGPKSHSLDRQAVGTVYDEIGTLDAPASSSTTRPLFRRFTSTMIGTPASWDFDGTDDIVQSAGSLAIAVPWSMVVIAQLDAVGALKYIMEGPTSGNRFILQGSPNASSAWGIFNGTQRSGGTASVGLHGFRVLNASGNDTLTVDGATIISGANAGDLSFAGMAISGGSGAPLDGQVSFVGVYNGDITADGNWAAFQTWCAAHYAVTVA